MSRRAVFGALTVMACAACGASPAVRLAERGDQAALRDALAVRQKAGDLSNAEAASLAKVVAEQALRTAPPVEAVDRVRDLRPCARELDAALASRMAVHDTAGAVAALARLEARGLGPGDVRKFVADGEPPWRAVGVRSLVLDDDREARLHALLDPSPLVRRAAARAAHDAADPRDLGALAEAARVDPEPIVRTEAVRAMAALSPAPSADVAMTLRDLWTAADDGVREDIALAWAATPIWAAGGRDALRVIVAAGHGPGVIEASAAVLRRSDADPEIESIAVGVLARAIDGGSRRTRLQALASAPLDSRHRPGLLPPIERAAADDDLEVRVSALSRLGEIKAPGAVEQLEVLAQPGSPVAGRARFALASAGDRRVQLWLEEDLASQSPESRLFAATALAALGVAARASPLLADSEASVRLRAACTIVEAARFGR